jgi:hypothetical protein
MAIALRIIDENGEVQKYVGLIEEEDLLYLTKMAEEKDLKCLPFVDYVGDTIFNAKQLEQVEKEIEILRQSGDIAEKILSPIERGVEEVGKNDLLFLRFEGE